MEEADLEHTFGVVEKVGNAAHASLVGLEEHVMYHHESEFIEQTDTLLSSIGGGVTHEDAFHMTYENLIDPNQFER